jgi:hypothetical protein
MAVRRLTDTQHGHPAPQPQESPSPAMLFALGAAPTAWLIQLLIGFATTSYVCFTGLAHPPPPGLPAWLQPLLIAANVAALLVALAGMAVGAGLLRRITEEPAHRAHNLLDVGEGRARFLATFSIFSSAVFCVGILANSFSLFAVPLCRS